MDFCFQIPQHQKGLVFRFGIPQSMDIKDRIASEGERLLLLGEVRLKSSRPLVDLDEARLSQALFLLVFYLQRDAEG